ncbi:2023_t:CDS:2, partial [Diversispora eburnea]
MKPLVKIEQYDITETILTKAPERFAQPCKQYKGQDWEELKCSNTAFLWKGVTNTLKRFASVPDWVVRLEQLFTIIEIFDIKELSEAGDFLEFLKSIAERDIENLINGYVDIYFVQQLLLELMNKVKSKDINIKKFLADLASINADNPTLVGKLLCVQVVIWLYKICEVTKEKIQNAVKKGNYSFERIGKDKKFTVSLTYLSEGINKRKDANEEQIEKTQIMDEFIRQIDLVHEICNVGVKLIQMGNFGYRQYKKLISDGNKIKELAEENIVDKTQKIHYYLTFSPAHHILTFLDYFTNDEPANGEICKTLIRFVNDKARLVPIKKGDFKISQQNYFEILCEIGAKIKNIFGDIPIQLRPLKTKGAVVPSDIVHRGRLFIATCNDKLLNPNIIMSIYTNQEYFPEPWQILICKSSTTLEELSIVQMLDV